MSRSSKPRLASGDVIEIVDPAANRAALSGSSTAHVPKAASASSRVSSFLRGMLGVTVVLGLVGAVLYVGLAATILFVSKPSDWNAVVMRGIYPEGQVPSGAVMLASNSPAASDAFGKVSEGLLGPSAESVVVVVAGPVTSVRNDSSGQILDGENPTGYFAPLDARDLRDEYVGICVSGACPEGEAVIVGADSLVGEVKGRIVGPRSLEPFPIPPSFTSPNQP